MHVDLNTIISQEIKGAVEAEVHKLKSDLQLTLIHLQQQIDTQRRHIALLEARAAGETDAPTRGEYDELHTQVQQIEKKVSTLLREKDIEDEQFTENVRQIAREVYDELQEADNGDDDTSTVLDQDNQAAEFRQVLLESLEEEEFTNALRDRIVEMFQNGAMTISIDKV